MTRIFTVDIPMKSQQKERRKSVKIQMPLPNGRRRHQSGNTQKSQQSSDGSNGNWQENEWFRRIVEIAKIFCIRAQDIAHCRATAVTRKAGTAMPFKEKIHPRYLEFEPLCCMSSCLIRGGCYSVVAFEVFYVVLTSLVIALKIYDGGRMDFWDPVDSLNFNALVTHQVLLYILVMFNCVTLVMATLLVYGLVSFQRVFIKIHWRFDFFSLAFNVIMFILYIFALSSEGPETWTWNNVGLVVAFATHIPVQIWACFVVKSCYDFYVLLYVFVTLAEK